MSKSITQIVLLPVWEDPDNSNAFGSWIVKIGLHYSRPKNACILMNKDGVNTRLRKECNCQSCFAQVVMYGNEPTQLVNMANAQPLTGLCPSEDWNNDVVKIPRAGCILLGRKKLTNYLLFWLRFSPAQSLPLLALQFPPRLSPFPSYPQLLAAPAFSFLLL